MGGDRVTSPAQGHAVQSASPSDLAQRRTVLTYVTGGVVIAVGAAAAVGSNSLRYWTDLGPGPGFFPLCLGVLLVAFGTLWVIKVARTPAAGMVGDAHGVGATATVGPAAPAPTGPTSETDAGEEFPEYSMPTVIAILGSLVLLAATLEILGYQLAMLLFLLFHLLVLGRRRLLLSLAIALAGSIGVFVIFTRFLTVPLPASSIPFLRDLGF